MNPVNATALYVSACRSVLRCDPRDPQALAELSRLLPFFRQSLACLVCGNVLRDPIAPTNSACQHYVCKACKGRKMMMKPSCSWCKDYEQFTENRQLRILVDCYRKLCEYVSDSALAVGGPPDLLALLEEGVSLDARPDGDVPSPDPSTSGTPTRDALPEVKERPVSPPGVNGLRDCNGVDELAVGPPTPRADAPAGADPDSVKQENFPSEIPVSEAVVAAAGEELCAGGMDMCGFAEDIKHDGGTLLLSVEEVLRTLEPEAHECPNVLHPGLGAEGNLNGPFGSARHVSSLPLDSSGILAPQRPPCQAVPHRAPSSGISCTAATPRPPRPNRKRSRSESDSEKVQPLPISTFIRSPVPGAPAPLKCEGKAPPPPHAAPHVAAVPNGGGILKVGKAVLVPSKGIKKTAEQHGPKKAYTKSKQGAPKSKDKTKERTLANPLVPGSPTKVVYKKPQEKKGCKCGRATQNPSVLTCRGQRCPCYSNRKACLDCICRGCQNSYMANGEKKLEAFAVPEKALEQTRLTLGINVTSIAVRSAAGGGGAAGVLSVPSAGGSPVPSFLSAAPHEDKGFDEALDMRFDC